MHRKHILLLTAFVTGVFWLSACSPKVSKPVAGTTEPAAPPAKHYSAAQLEEGHAIYTNSCGRCHKLFVPADKSQDKWERVLPRMIKRAKLTEGQGELVRAYVMANLK